MTQWIIICGDVVNGLSFYGPYNSSDEAMRDAELNIDGEWTVAQMTPVTEPQGA